MTSDTNFLTWIVASGGWIVAIFLAWLGYRERRELQHTERLMKTVAYFEGGTQKRSIGLALVEGLLSLRDSHAEVLIPLLANQFVYLLLNPEVRNSVHEERNLVRIFVLLSRVSDLQSRHHDSWCEVGDAIYRRLEGEQSGLSIAEPTLRLWRKKLKHSEKEA